MTDFLGLAIAVGSWLHVPGGAWCPTESQIAELRTAIEPYAQEQAVAWGEELAPWARYTIQYQGQVVDGEQVIFVSALCSDPPDSADEEFVFVFDGGTCYFRTYWNPKIKKFSRFGFNGHA